MSVTPGSYIGKVINYGVKKTLKGDPAIVIVFGFEFNGEAQQMTWQGGLNNQRVDGKKSQQDITFAALEVCGFDFKDKNVVNNFNALADGASSGVLDTDVEVDLKIELEANNDGNMYPRIKWINRVGGGLFKNLISKEEAVQSFAGFNILGDVISYGTKTKSSPVKSKPVSDDSIPF